MAHRADRPALERALARNVGPAVYTEDVFKTTRDAANREAVRAVIRADLDLVGPCAPSDGLKFHSVRFVIASNGCAQILDCFAALAVTINHRPRSSPPDNSTSR